MTTKEILMDIIEQCEKTEAYKRPFESEYQQGGADMCKTIAEYIKETHLTSKPK